MTQTDDETALLPRQLLDEHSYKKVLTMACKVVSSMIRHFAAVRLVAARKDYIIVNFLSRASATTKSMMHLYDLNDYSSFMILLRIVIERILYLGHLELTNAYEEFEKDTIWERHRQLHRIKSDADMVRKAGSQFKTAYQISHLLVKNIKRMFGSKKGLPYHAETSAKQMKLDFLYTYGYEVASSYVHPMADEGSQELEELIANTVRSLGSEKASLLQNACFALLLLVRYSVKYSSMAWDSRYSSFVDAMMKYTGTGDKASIVKGEILMKEIEDVIN